MWAMKELAGMRIVKFVDWRSRKGIWRLNEKGTVVKSLIYYRYWGKKFEMGNLGLK